MAGYHFLLIIAAIHHVNVRQFCRNGALKKFALAGYEHRKHTLGKVEANGCVLI